MSAPSREVTAIDQMDEGLDLLRTAWLALHTRDLLTETMLDAVTNTINDVILRLEPVREKLNCPHHAA